MFLSPSIIFPTEYFISRRKLDRKWDTVFVGRIEGLYAITGLLYWKNMINFIFITKKEKRKKKKAFFFNRVNTIHYNNRNFTIK